MKEAQTLQEALNAALNDLQAWKAAALAAQSERESLAAQVEQLEEEVLRLHFFDIDVIRCLKTIAFAHNHSDMALYQELAKKCMSDISSRKPLAEIRAKAVREFAESVINEHSTTELCAHYGGRGTDASDLTEKTVVDVDELRASLDKYTNKIRQGGE